MPLYAMVLRGRVVALSLLAAKPNNTLGRSGGVPPQRWLRIPSRFFPIYGIKKQLVMHDTQTTNKKLLLQLRQRRAGWHGLRTKQKQQSGCK